VYGFKMEGNTVGLWIRDVSDVSVYGTGGCGCNANDTVYPQGYAVNPVPSMYRIQRSTNILFANVMDQGHNTGAGHPNMFNEVSCDTAIENTLVYDPGNVSASALGGAGRVRVTRPFDRPVYYWIGNQSAQCQN
jgi:hypothetical protein